MSFYIIDLDKWIAYYQLLAIYLVLYAALVAANAAILFDSLFGEKG